MRKPNPNLSASRRRKQSLLPQIAQLVREGHDRRAICEKLELTRSSLSRWLKELPRESGTQHSPEIAALIVRHIARYESIYEKSIAAWDLSQADKQIKLREDSGTAGNGTDAADAVSKTKRSVRLESRTGDVAYLDRAMEALKAIERLNGIDAPRRSEAADPSGLPQSLADLTPEELAKMSDEQLETLNRRWLEKFGQAQTPAAETLPSMSAEQLCEHKSRLREVIRRAGSGPPQPT